MAASRLVVVIKLDGSQREIDLPAAVAAALLFVLLLGKAFAARYNEVLVGLVAVGVSVESLAKQCVRLSCDWREMEKSGSLHCRGMCYLLSAGH